jgi:hypothetical protein
MKMPAASLALAALALAAAPAAAQESGAFIIRLGRDTVLVEQYTRTGDRIEGTMVGRTPRTSIRSYTATLRPDGTVSRLEMTTRVPAAPELLPQTITVTTGADSADMRIVRGDTVRESRIAAGAAAFPFVFNSYALTEPVLRHAAAQRVDSAAVAIVQPGARQAGTLSVIRHGADSVLIRSQAGVARVRVDAQGRVLGAHSPESTFKGEVQRVDRLDVQALAADFARRDQAGQQMGTLSPRDSVAATAGGANVSVAYGRPAMRGRRIIGQVVPYGQVWRTGANDATHFRTDRDLVIGDARVPAGSYTLWTIPGPDEWTLIVNRQTGQWGTVYDPAQDVARIPVRATRAAGPPVELLTMTIHPGECGDGGTLRMAWENTVVAVPFTVAP